MITEAKELSDLALQLRSDKQTNWIELQRIDALDDVDEAIAVLEGLAGILALAELRAE